MYLYNWKIRPLAIGHKAMGHKAAFCNNPRGGRSRTRELIHDVHKQRFGIKFACSYDYLKVNLKFNRYASSTPFNPGIPGE